MDSFFWTDLLNQGKIPVSFFLFKLFCYVQKKRGQAVTNRMCIPYGPTPAQNAGVVPQCVYHLSSNSRPCLKTADWLASASCACLVLLIELFVYVNYLLNFTSQCRLGFLGIRYLSTENIWFRVMLLLVFFRFGHIQCMFRKKNWGWISV